MSRLLFFTFISLILFRAQAQTCIHGTIADDSTGVGLPGAVLYLPELNTSAETNEEGKFRICNMPHGNFVIQVKLLGYRTFISSINEKDSALVLRIRLHGSAAQIPEIVVYGSTSGRTEETPNNISSLNAEEMRGAGALNLSDGIAKIPGVSQLTTGAGISKPVIRGLFGNRIQTVLLGLRFDNQQWQDEHGLGLSDAGVEKVEIIKGAASLLYGSEAMGGVLNIIEENPAPVGKTQGDFSVQAFTNTYGLSSDAGIRSSKEKYNWRLRIGEISHGDYSDGNNFRVLNSRFNGYFGKTSLGFNRKKWSSKNDYLFSLSNFGFLMDPSQLNALPDSRLARNFERPHHTVFLHLISSQNTLYLRDSKLKCNAGLQVNNRQEQEGGNKISLDMWLNTATADVIWTKNTGPRTELSIGGSGLYQTNRNAGSRTIIPDASNSEASAYSYVKHVRKYFATELGARFDLKGIQTFATGTINTDPFSPGSNIVPFSRSYSAVNGSAGISLFDNVHWNFKTNISSGYRPGNLAELSSNGLHEGTVRYEIGNTDMKVEQNICADAFMGFENKWLSASVSAYANRFFNYIYLSPTPTEYIGFRIFRYIQKNSLLTGTEASAELHPSSLRHFMVKSSYAGVVGKTDDGDFLPFIPAQKISAEIRYLFSPEGKTNSPYLRAGADFIMAQNHPDQFETPTPGYWLLNSGAEWRKSFSKREMTIGISANNLLNTAYFDHLSRFKYFGIYNIGINVALNFKLTFE